MQGTLRTPSLALFLVVLLASLPACGAGASTSRRDTLCRIVAGVRVACAAVDAYAPSCAPTEEEPMNDNSSKASNITVGRSVHYTAPDGTTRAAQCVALVVKRYDGKSSPPTCRPNLQVLRTHDAGADFVRQVPFAAEPTPGHWSRPPVMDAMQEGEIHALRLSAFYANDERAEELVELAARTMVHAMPVGQHIARAAERMMRDRFTAEHDAAKRDALGLEDQDDNARELADDLGQRA